MSEYTNAKRGAALAIARAKRAEMVKKKRDALPPGHSQCSMCKTVKPLADFSKDNRRYNGVDRRCRVCLKTRNSKRYEAKKEKRTQQTQPIAAPSLWQRISGWFNGGNK